MKLAQMGITVDVPSGWDAWFFLEENNSVVHLASFPLQREPGHSFGMNNIDLMPPGGTFMALLEYGPESANTPLFSEARPRAVAPPDLSPRAFVSAQPGRYARQWSFTESGRAFCLYCVVADLDLQRPLEATPMVGAVARAAGEATGVIASIKIDVKPAPQAQPPAGAVPTTP